MAQNEQFADKRTCGGGVSKTPFFSGASRFAFLLHRIARMTSGKIFLRRGSPVTVVVLLIGLLGCGRAEETRFAGGKLKSRTGYKLDELDNHVLHGEYAGWFENGNRRVLGRYVDGQPEGMWQMWHENGQLWQRSHYVKGDRVGISSTWRADGSKIWDIDNSRPDGDLKITTWHRVGSKQWEGVGRFVHRSWTGTGQWWDEAGNPVDPPHDAKGPISWPGALGDPLNTATLVPIQVTAEPTLEPPR